MMEGFSPASAGRPDQFSAEVRAKVLCLLFLLHNYEETVHYGSILRVHDPHGLLFPVLAVVGAEAGAFAVVRRMGGCWREWRTEVESVCRLKNGLVVVEREEEVEELELYLQDKKMTAYLNKIIVLAGSSAHAHVSLEVSPDQLRLSLADLALRRTAPALHQEKTALFQQLLSERKRRADNEELFFRAAATINTDTETYTEEVNRYRGLLAAADLALAQL